MKKNNSIKEILEVIKNAEQPIFISHENPDGDTYGSSFALRAGLSREDCKIACGSKIEWPFTELGIEDTIFDISKEDCDLYVFLDCADDLRCGELIKNGMKENVRTINIDHHQSNTFYADYNYVIERSSTCELIFDILMEYNDTVSKKTANYLYMGVASDTGLFVHGYTTEATFYTASRLVHFGAEFDRIGKILFRTISKGTALLTGKLFNNLEIIDDIIALSYVTNTDFENSNSEYKDSESLISHLTSIDGIEISIILKQMEKDVYKASLRSTKDYDISKLAIANGGGGHKQAAGCKFKGEIEDIKKKIIEEMHQLEIL
jgi:phosphoesterase RecJ-like protein